jgi:4-hydroxybenzoate polyprenyltransferase
MIYVRSVKTKNYNDRTIWYRAHYRSINTFLNVIIGIAIFGSLLFISKSLPAFFFLSGWRFIFLIIFPVVAAWYTLTPSFFNFKKIRQTGWLKPFVVGFTWAGWVTIYPLILFAIQTRSSYKPELFTFLLLWLINFLFFSINAIIFDIKDFRTDSFHLLKTYPVVFGVRNTFRFIVLPLTLLNLVVFFIFQWHQNFTFWQTSIQLIPYLLLVVIIATYRHGRGVLYYLAAVDGLVFLKAFCGITSILIIKK